MPGGEGSTKSGRRRSDIDIGSFVYDVHKLTDWAFGDEKHNVVGVAELLRTLARSSVQVELAVKLQKEAVDNQRWWFIGAIAAGLGGPHLGVLWDLIKAHF